MTVKLNLFRLEKEIIAFESKPVQKGKILFYGDSAFTRWNERFGITPLEVVIPGTLNHGFGSSTAEEMLYFYDRAVRPYAPKAIVYKTFGNDIISGYTPEEILFLSERILEYARRDFPGIKFFLAAPFYHYGQYPKFPNFQKDRLVFDGLLKEYAKRYEDCVYFSLMDDPRFTIDGKTGPNALMRRELFQNDGIHFNQEGFDLFADYLKVLLKDLI